MAEGPAVQNDTEQLRRRNRELSILNAIAQALNREVDLSQALNTTLAQVAKFLDLQAGWIWLMSEDSQDSYLAASQDLPSALADNHRLMEGDCYCLRTFREDDLEGAANVNVIECSRLRNLVDGTDGLRYHASIPLYSRNDKKIGVLNVASSDWRELSPDDLRLLYTIGDLLGIAVERARLFQRSAELGAAEERNRLAREIHDTIAQGLSAISLQLESADALLDADADVERVRKAVRQALELTRDNLEEARRSVLDLRATPLEGRSLVEALAVLADEHTSKLGLPTNLEMTGGARPLSARIEAGLYRITQEALTNVVKHAHADHVVLKLAWTSDAVTLSISDDGVGFDTESIPTERYGLTGLSERARLLGASLQLESSPNVGTRVSVSVPL